VRRKDAHKQLARTSLINVDSFDSLILVFFFLQRQNSAEPGKKRINHFTGTKTAKQPRRDLNAKPVAKIKTNPTKTRQANPGTNGKQTDRLVSTTVTLQKEEPNRNNFFEI